MHKFMEQFLEIASCLSVTVAAKKLCVSQPTLTHNMKKYEQQLGTTLFERTARGIRLTESGEIVFEKARAMRHIQESMLSSLDNLTLHQQKEIRVGTGDAWWALFMKDVIQQYADNFPQANINVDVGNQVYLMDKLLSDEIDLFIGHELKGLTRSGQVSFFPMFSQADYIYVNQTHPLIGTVVNNEALARFPIINIGHPNKKLTYLLNDLSTLNSLESSFTYSASTVHYTNSLMVVIDRLLESDALFTYPMAMKGFFAELGIVPLTLEKPIEASTIGLYVIKEKAQSEHLQSVIMKITEAAQQRIQ
ncbi:LysR family transcriptional regulator [Vibrio maerlii]|uniref:LysR family transcriptional regulator n=1 Tax=Vibrio maerlii TaxID=2231648 RepID=UPI000E3D7C49|nr:LysR family transcriptional regulator [Vibrio maerlii]